MRLLSALLALPLIPHVLGLHFYFESTEKRCFLEELASETIVEGHYRALLWNESSKAWEGEPSMGIHVNVEVRLCEVLQGERGEGRADGQELSSGHTVVNTRGPPDGRFTFTSHEAGDHQICLHSNITGGWLTTQVIKMYLDINVGSAKHDTENDISHVTTIVTKLRDLNKKVQDIQREQRYMREVEATFRDASEATNARAVWWSVIQIAVLIGAAVWQMRHLKVYFEDKKLR